MPTRPQLVAGALGQAGSGAPDGLSDMILIRILTVDHSQAAVLPPVQGCTGLLLPTALTQPWGGAQGPAMCGILAALLLSGDAEKNRRDVLKRSKLLRHRGPDQNSIHQSADGRSFIAFERLMIIDPTDTGRQVKAPACTCKEGICSRVMLAKALPTLCRQPFKIETPEGNIAWALYVAWSRSSTALAALPHLPTPSQFCMRLGLQLPAAAAGRLSLPTSLLLQEQRDLQPPED
jgi:hypothetical protein